MAVAHGYDPWSSHSVRIWRLDQRQFREHFQGSIGGNLRSMVAIRGDIWGSLHVY